MCSTSATIHNTSRMFSLIYDIIQYAFGSIIVGLLLAVSMVGLLFFLIRGFYPKKTFSPLSILAGIVLAVLLIFRLVPMCGAIALKWKCTDVKEWLDTNLIHPEQYLIPRDISSEESVRIAEELIEQYPIISTFADTGIFEGHTTATISTAMAETLNSYLNPFIWKAIIWSLVYVIVAAAIVVYTMKVKRDRSYTNVSIDDDFNMSGGGFDDLSGTSF